MPITLTTAGVAATDNWDSTHPQYWLSDDLAGQVNDNYGDNDNDDANCDANDQVHEVPLPGLARDVPMVLNVQAVGYYRQGGLNWAPTSRE